MMRSGLHRNLEGHRHGRLVAQRLAPGLSRDGHRLWECACDCGGAAVVASNNLTRGTGTRSCGCLLREAAKARVAKNGTWNEGKSYATQNGERCYKTRHSWAKAALRHYGNRCQSCGWDKARCDVHHRKPKGQGGLHTIKNAIVLCPNCHRIQHECKGARA